MTKEGFPVLKGRTAMVAALMATAVMAGIGLGFPLGIHVASSTAPGPHPVSAPPEEDRLEAEPDRSHSQEVAESDQPDEEAEPAPLGEAAARAAYQAAAETTAKADKAAIQVARHERKLDALARQGDGPRMREFLNEWEASGLPMTYKEASSQLYAARRVERSAQRAWRSALQAEIEEASNSEGSAMKSGQPNAGGAAGHSAAGPQEPPG